MIEFEINPKYYKEIHNALNAVANECRMEFTKQGVSTTLVCPANVLMGIINIPKKAFESLKVDKTVYIGYKLKLFETASEQTMFLDSPVNHKFSILQEDGLTEGQLITTARIKHDIFTDKVKLYDVESIRKKPKVPKVVLPCVFKLLKSTLVKLVKRGKSVRFEVDNGELVCRGDTDWKTNPIAVKSEEKANSNFSNDELKYIVKAIPKNIIEVTMSMGVDYPCTVEFKICDGKVPVKYLLAPRIESD